LGKKAIISLYSITLLVLTTETVRLLHDPNPMSEYNSGYPSIICKCTHFPTTDLLTQICYYML